MPSPSEPSHYFDPAPSVGSRRRTVDLVLPEGRLVTLITDQGVFSGDHVDPGTRLLIATAPPLDDARTLVDVGCGYGPIAITMALRLVKEEGVRADDVAGIEILAHKRRLPHTDNPDPQTPLQAKFSMEFCMAILLLDGRANLPEFTDETVLRDDVQELIRRVDFRVDQRAEDAGYARMTTYIDVRLKDGRTVSGHADFGKGSPANPMSFDEVADKFRGCAEFARWPRDRAEAIVDIVARLERTDDLAPLAAALAA